MEIVSWIVRIGGIATFIFAIIIFINFFKKV